MEYQASDFVQQIFGRDYDYSKPFNLTEIVQHTKPLIDKYLDLVGILRPKIDKCNFMSTKYRQEGNNFFASGEYFNALESYNQSICFAQNGSESVGIGYANRSAVYFVWKMYELCLENICLAKCVGLPKHILDKIRQREIKCKENLKQTKNKRQESDALYHPELSFQRNPKIPMFADCLEIEQNNQFGRHVITKRDLKVGQIVAIEEPHCAALNSSQRYRKCANCLQENDMSLIPCKNCTAVMFCSPKCYDEGQSDFHKIECKIVDFIFKECDDAFPVLRIILKAMKCFESVDEMISFSELIQLDDRPIDYSVSCPKEAYGRICKLSTNDVKREPNELFDYVATASLIVKVLSEYTDLKSALPSNREHEFLTKILFRHLQSSQVNTFEIHNLTDTPKAGRKCLPASGIYAACSNFNHSCAPNVREIFWKTKIVMNVLKPIRKGEQLCITYRCLHMGHPLEERQRELQEKHKFKCSCVACVNNYPLMKDLPDANLQFPFALHEQIDIMKFDKEFIRANIHRLIDFLNRYYRHYPCVEIDRAEELLSTAWKVLMTPNLSVCLKDTVNE